MVNAFVLILVVVVACLVVLWLRADKARKHLEARFQRTGVPVEIENGTLNVVDLGPPRGGGPPLVLIHDSGANHNDFKLSMGERLARDNRVVIVDRPGCGWSDPIKSATGSTPEDHAIAIAQALEKLEARNPVLVGHGTGAAVALAFALSYPEDLAGLVLVSPVAYPQGTQPDWARRLASLALIGPALASIITPEVGPLFLHRRHAKAFSPQPVPVDYAQSTASALCYRTATYVEEARDQARLDSFLEEQSQFYSEISVPVVIVNGDRDRTVASPSQADKLALEIRDVRHVVLNGIGHMAHHTSPNVIGFEISRLAERLWNSSGKF
ncbi:MAG: alpha/beta fold hydrolase [Alphaproteobacteria bacterium]